MSSISPFLASRWIKLLRESGLDFSQCSNIKKLLEKIFSHRGKILLLDVTGILSDLSKTDPTSENTTVRNLLGWFLLKLKDRRNHNKLKRFIREFEKQTLKTFGKKKIKILSAVPLEENEKARIVKDLCRFGVDPNDQIEFDVDSSIIGSFKVFIDDKLLDTSFESFVNQFYNR